MSKMKNLLANMFEREEEIVTVLKLAKEKRPAFYKLVRETPTIRITKNLLRGITDDTDFIMLVSAYISNKTIPKKDFG